MPNHIEAGAIPIIAPQRKAAQLRESKMSAPTHSTNQKEPTGPEPHP